MTKLKIAALISILLVVSMGLWAGGGAESETPAVTTEEGVGPTNSNQLSDLRVRQAIAYAIDMDTIAETLLEGMAIVADSSIPNGAWKASGLNPYSYDPDKARALLKAANWDKDRVLDAVFYYGDQQTVDLMIAIQAYLADVGIKMTFRKLEGDVGAQWHTLPADPVKGPSGVIWDLGYGACAALALQEYYNNNATGLNSHTPGDPKLDALIAAINGTSDVAKQKEAFFAIERYENDNLPVVPLYYSQLFILESTRFNRRGESYGNAMYNFDWGITNWTVTPDEDGKQVLYTNGGPIELFENPWDNLGIWISNRVLFDRLIAADGSLTPIGPQMASDYKLSADGMSLTFTLRDGLTWHDGSPLTVEDIKWSVEYALQVPTLHGVCKKTFNALKGAQAFKDGTANEVSGIVTDGNTISFDFETLDPNVLLTFSQWAPLPKKYFADVDPLKFRHAPYWQKPVGCGPFKVQEVQMNDYLVMVPFEDYYGGVAKLDQIVCYPSFDVDPNLVKNAAAGRLDYGFTKSVEYVKALQEMSHMKIRPVDMPYTRILWINKFPKE